MLATSILAVSLDVWTPVTVVLVIVVSIYAACQGAVMIIRALRGDHEKTSLELLFANLANSVQQQGAQLGQLQQNFVPPEAVPDMIRGHVLAQLAAIRNKQQAAAVAVPTPAPASVPVQLSGLVIAAPPAPTEPTRTG